MQGAKAQFPSLTITSAQKIYPKRPVTLEVITRQALPYAPCKATCKPNGYDKEDKRLSFVCSKQCLSHPNSVPEPIPNCPYSDSPLGYATHKPISENPRLLCEIPRGTKRWKKIRNLRPASERTNSTAKADLDILAHPQVMSLERASILAQLACMVVLLKRFLDFVVRVTITLRRAIATSSKRLWKELGLKKVPSWLISIIQKK